MTARDLSELLSDLAGPQMGINPEQIRSTGADTDALLVASADDLVAERAQPRRRRRIFVLGALAAALLVAVAGVRIERSPSEPDVVQAGNNPASPGASSTPDTNATSGSSLPARRQLSPPATFTATNGTKTVELTGFSYCGSGGCADGVPQHPLVDLGASSSLTVSVSHDGWELGAGLSREGDPCAASQGVQLTKISARTFRLDAAGFAGPYDVQLSGRGPEGDLAAAFRWTTTTDGPLATPQATLTALVDHDGVVDSYGVSLSVLNVATSPTMATANIEVTAANGAAMNIAPTRPVTAGPGCATTGTLIFEAPTQAGKQAAALGPGPFTLVVTLALDDGTHAATTTFPNADSSRGPSTPLVFDPPLPALTERDRPS